MTDLAPCTITCDGKTFFLTIPGVRASESSYTVEIPCERTDALRRILTDRDRLSRAGKADRATIGTLASPTRQLVEAFASVHGPINVEERRLAEKAESIEAKWGISLDDIEI